MNGIVLHVDWLWQPAYADLWKYLSLAENSVMLYRVNSFY